MKIETKNVYIAADGKEFDTLEECQNYESKSVISVLENKLADLIIRRDTYLSRKNRYKTNKHGKLARTEAALLNEYKNIQKMMKVPIKKMSLEELEAFEKSIKAVIKYRLQRIGQKDTLDDLKYLIKESGKQIKDLYEKLVKLKLEKLNS